MNRRCPQTSAPKRKIFAASSAKSLALAILAVPLLAACGVTSRMEPYKQTDAVLNEGEQVVILARRHHANHEAEQEFINCISDSLSRGSNGIGVHPSSLFEDKCIRGSSRRWRHSARTISPRCSKGRAS